MKNRVWAISLSACLLLGGMSAPSNLFSRTNAETIHGFPGGGGGDDKKAKGEKGEKDEEKKAAKIKRSPRKAARLSVQTTRKNNRMKQKEIMTRAKTRKYLHKSFNTKYGRYTNFRSKFTRSRWRKGKI